MSDKERIEKLEKEVLELKKELKIVKDKAFESDKLWEDAIDRFGEGVAG